MAIVGLNEESVNVRNQSLRPKQQGFSFVELVMVIVILGVLSVVAMPTWFNRTYFEERGYFNELIQAVRYTQKLAVTSNCDARINIMAGSFTLERPTVNCDTSAWSSVSLPGTTPPYTAPTDVTVTAGTGTITFHASGQATMSMANPITVNGAISMRVHSATGYMERQ